MSITNVISRSTMSLEVKKGQPPEDAIRIALKQLFIGMAQTIENYDGRKMEIFFPLFFPLRMTMVSEREHWDFEIHLKIENSFSKEEN